MSISVLQCEEIRHKKVIKKIKIFPFVNMQILKAIVHLKIFLLQVHGWIHPVSPFCWKYFCYCCGTEGLYSVNKPVKQ